MISSHVTSSTLCGGRGGGGEGKGMERFVNLSFSNDFDTISFFQSTFLQWSLRNLKLNIYPPKKCWHPGNSTSPTNNTEWQMRTVRYHSGGSMEKPTWWTRTTPVPEFSVLGEKHLPPPPFHTWDSFPFLNPKYRSVLDLSSRVTLTKNLLKLFGVWAGGTASETQR